MKTKLFIDFDGTMFDTDGFKKTFLPIFKQTGASDDEIKRTYDLECLDYKYSPEGNLVRLRELVDFDLQLYLDKLKSTYYEASKFVFPDTIEFLERIDRESYEVNLLTLGDIRFQQTKFKHSLLDQYFDNQYFTEQQKWIYLEGIVDKTEKFFLIDDRADTIEEVAKKFIKSEPIHIYRPQEGRDPMEADSNYRGLEVRKLTQAINYL